MIYRYFLKLKYILASKAFFITIFISLILITVSNAQWLIDEYINHTNNYSIFNKLLLMKNETKGSYIFYWAFPLLASTPCSWNYSRISKNEQNQTNTSIKNTFTQISIAFITGGIVIFLSFIIDFWMLSMITKTVYAVPNDMTTSYHPQQFCSQIFFESPRLFVLIWSFIGFLWGGAFSLLSMALYFIVKKLPIMYFLEIAIYILNYLISIKLHITPWNNLLCASYSSENFFYNILSVICISIIFLFLKYFIEKIFKRNMENI